MIVIGNAKFATGMKFAGVKRSYKAESRERVLDILKNVAADEFILANASAVEMVPELKEFKNLAVMPDDSGNFSDISDLKEIIRSVVGIELEVG
ncbi:hypothetical protein KJ891_01630 [Candidatus Micrarchaeota archaeon]|nr:hypothetical protein [Candidatus Micrarchaeota archaeon]